MNLPLKPLCSLLPDMLGSMDWLSSCPLAQDNSEDSLSKPPHCLHDKSRPSLYESWFASRTVGEHDEITLTPGGQRALTSRNVFLALEVSERCVPQIMSLLWSLHPLRVMLMVALDIFRGILPACRGYSQALIINEVR